jgi:hypothetical protein
LGNLKTGDHWEDLGVRWENNITIDLEEIGFGDLD